MRTSEVGSIALGGSQYHIAIDAVVTITMPTTAQRAPRMAAGAVGIPTRAGGTLSMILSVDTQNARFTVDGTSPSATNGILVIANSVTTFRGEDLIKALKIIGTAAGGFINYVFTVDEG